MLTHALLYQELQMRNSMRVSGGQIAAWGGQSGISGRAFEGSIILLYTFADGKSINVVPWDGYEIWSTNTDALSRRGIVNRWDDTLGGNIELLKGHVDSSSSTIRRVIYLPAIYKGNREIVHVGAMRGAIPRVVIIHDVLGVTRLYVDGDMLAAICKNSGFIHVLFLYKNVFRTSGLELFYLILGHLLLHAYLFKFIIEILIPLLWLSLVVEYLRRKIFVILERLELRTTDEFSRWKEFLQDLLKQKLKDRKQFYWLRFSEALQDHFVSSEAYSLLLRVLHDSRSQEYG